MPQHSQTMAKEHYYDWYTYKNNQRCYIHLIFEKFIKITKIRIME